LKKSFCLNQNTKKDHTVLQTIIYRYLNIRFNSKYSRNLNTKDVIPVINKINGLARKDKCKFENDDNLPWLVLSLVKCNERGNYSIDEGEYFEEINLIEFIFAEDEESYNTYITIAKEIAHKFNWEVVDDHNNEMVVGKRFSTQ
jgi:hypothetical protein